MINLGKWSFTPGPAENPPGSSLDLRDLIEYPPEVVAEAILAFPKMRVLESAPGDWWHWWAAWSHGDRRIGVGMSVFETEPVSWGGSPLQGACELADILELWEVIRSRCPGVWMHNSDCAIHTPDSSRRLFMA
jgi:hypothetical protein